MSRQLLILSASLINWEQSGNFTSAMQQSPEETLGDQVTLLPQALAWWLVQALLDEAESGLFAA
jgi:hypothetical protein